MFALRQIPARVLLCILAMSAYGHPCLAQEKAAVEKAAVEKAAAEKAVAEKTAVENAANAANAASGHEKAAADVSAAQKGSAAEKESAAGHGTSHSAGSHGHGGGHDATDLSHQNSTPGLTEALDWRSDSAVATLLIFLCLLALLSKFAWRPVMEGLEGRERAIAEKIDDARRSAEKAAEQLRQYEARLASATEEARGILDQARKDAETAKARILAEAQELAQRERQRAVDDISAAKNVALQEMTQKSVDLAVSLAGRLIRKQLRPEDHSQLIREMVDQFPSRN